MFIQRTSGPTIGFYCLDVFEITYTTYASVSVPIQSDRGREKALIWKERCDYMGNLSSSIQRQILAALGQNFLLIVDFVRSYAEVGREYAELDLTQIDLLTESMFNSTLDVIDEMAGTHLTEHIGHGGGHQAVTNLTSATV